MAQAKAIRILMESNAFDKGRAVAPEPAYSGGHGELANLQGAFVASPGYPNSIQSSTSTGETTLVLAACSIICPPATSHPSLRGRNGNRDISAIVIDSTLLRSP